MHHRHAAGGGQGTQRKNVTVIGIQGMGETYRARPGRGGGAAERDLGAGIVLVEEERDLLLGAAEHGKPLGEMLHHHHAQPRPGIAAAARRDRCGTAVIPVIDAAAVFLDITAQEQGNTHPNGVRHARGVACHETHPYILRDARKNGIHARGEIRVVLLPRGVILEFDPHAAARDNHLAALLVLDATTRHLRGGPRAGLTPADDIGPHDEHVHGTLIPSGHLQRRGIGTHLLRQGAEDTVLGRREKKDRIVDIPRKHMRGGGSQLGIIHTPPQRGVRHQQTRRNDRQAPQ